MQKWQAVIFDLDDTLYPERDYVISGFRAVAVWVEQQSGIPKILIEKELKYLFSKGIRGKIFNLWLQQRGLPLDWVPKLVQVYRGHRPNLKLFPDAKQILYRLKERYLIGLVSDGYLEVQKEKFKALNLSPFFDAVLFTDELGQKYWKPSPRPFKEILHRLKVIQPEKAIYIGDNPKKDFLGARQVGLITVRILRPEGEYNHLTPPTFQHAPHYTIHSLVELEALLS